MWSHFSTGSCCSQQFHLSQMSQTIAVAPADPVVESVIWRICLFVLFYFACVVHTVVHITEQILVNKSDHPHQREPWCFVEVVNKVGAGAMPTLQ